MSVPTAAGQRLRVGMLGGAFDPPHWAHRALAEAALAQLQLDALHIVPTGQAWHKSRALSAVEHRLAMCDLAFAGLQRTRIDARETLRAGPSFTADTLAELALEYPGAELFLVLGADQLLAFQGWQRWSEVLERATLAVADRPLHGSGVAAPEPELDPNPDRPVANASTAAALDLSAVTLPYVRLHMPLHPISATAVRARIGHASSPAPTLELLVPPAVARYISDHQLYLQA